MTEPPGNSRHQDPHLPPPAFPPSTSWTRHFQDPDPGEAGAGSIPDDAIHGPDDPVLRLEAPSVPPDFEEVMSGAGGLEGVPDEGSVTGMAPGPAPRPAPGEPHADPHVAELSAALERLRRGLDVRGEAALRVDAGMSRFDATLRAYCVGYLAGRRADDPILPPPT